MIATPGAAALCLRVVFLFVYALLFALVEIEIEGPYGWAERLPTWFRVTTPAARFYGLFMRGKPLTGYHADKDRIAAFLEQNGGDTLIVPYRENRAVLFESRLFHRSDAPHFAPGHENRRINVTLLFGRRH